MLFLHGFPEHRGAWRKVALALAGEYYCLLPDLRGYGQSGRPTHTSAYHINKLLADLDALVDACQSVRPVLVGHDWGGVLAWWYAALYPQKIERLIVANAPHPSLLQRRLIDTPEQRQASQYFRLLRQPDGAQYLLANGADGLWERLFAHQPSLTPADRADYIASWEIPGAMEAMIDWYRMAPFIVPAQDVPACVPDWALGSDLRVSVSTLILWGMNDTVFLPCLLEGLDEVAPSHRIERFEDAGHGIIHDAPDALASAIREFCRS